MTEKFTELAALAEAGAPEFADVSRDACVEAARAHAKRQRKRIRARHREGESGSNVLRLLSEAADTLVRGVTEFGLYQTRRGRKLLSRVAICPLGGYGRRELSPNSDLDVCLLYGWRMDRDIDTLNKYLVPFLWDMGFTAGYTLHSTAQATRLARDDPKMFTSFLQARVLHGANAPLARLRQRLKEMQQQSLEPILERLRLREFPERLPEAYQELYAPEPDLKESAGGLRDYHAGFWMLQLGLGVRGLDDLDRLGHISSDELLGLVDALDFVWRVRNEVHFHTGKAQNRLTFALQKHVARVFDYGEDSQQAVDRFMEDYYGAAEHLRWFYLTAVRLCDHHLEVPVVEATGTGRSNWTVHRGQLRATSTDDHWFAENPSRLMEVMWQCTRRHVPLSYETENWIRENLSLVTYAFRSSNMVRRYFMAICGRPMQAGHGLRQMANTGLLAAYIPEFGDIEGVVRYEDFHSYPVNEHTLRAVEALAQIGRLEGPISRVLQHVIESVRNPQILVLAILLHDLGKASGEAHVEEGVRIARRVCARIGLAEEEAEQVEFLVRHHMLMSDISFYRDTNDVDIVNNFAATLKTDERLRELLLLTYADLSAVGPNVWNEWKGALLVKLFLKAERILMGREEVSEEEEYWSLPKARQICEIVPEALRGEVENHLRAFGERYFVSFSPGHIARHLDCIEEARQSGLALRCKTHADTDTSDVVICTRDRRGLFAMIAGSFSAQLVDVQTAALFTGPDGYVIDCFTVQNAVNRRPLTDAQFRSVEKTLRSVLIDGTDVRQHVEQSRRRIFALEQSGLPAPARVSFDNDSSGTDTVIDLDTGDRTGLLYDVASALADLSVDIQSARIMTDARRARDAFYVRMENGKIEDSTTQAAVREGVLRALRPSDGTAK